MTRTIYKGVAITVIALFAIGAGQESARAGQKALLIGIGAYPYMPADKQLSGPPNDARAMKNFLLEHWGFSSSDIRVLLDHDATKTGILDALHNWLPNASQPGDRIVVYYSGHGTWVKDVSGDEADGKDEAFAPSDSGRTRGTGELILDDEIAAAFSRLSDRQILLIADSCHSGTVARLADFDTEPRETHATARYLSPDHFVPDTGTEGPARDRVTRFRDEEPMSREVGAHLTLSAAMPYQYSWESNGKGIFTTYLIHALTDLRADLNGNGRVTTAEAINFMKPKLEAYCKGIAKCRQVGFTPNIDPKDETFVLMPAPADESIPVVEEDDIEAVSDVLPSVADHTIAVEIHPSNQHRIGDEVTFKLTSAMDGYLTLLDLNADGELVLLFPTEEDTRRGKSGRIRANQPLHVPDKSYGFSFEAQAPTGQGQLIAVVTEDHVDLSDLLERHGDLESIEDPVRFVKSISGRLHAVWTKEEEKNRGARWAVGYTDYQISE